MEVLIGRSLINSPFSIAMFDYMERISEGIFYRGNTTSSTSDKSTYHHWPCHGTRRCPRFPRRKKLHPDSPDIAKEMEWTAQKTEYIWYHIYIYIHTVTWTENCGKIHHIWWENSLFLLPFSIAMENHRRVYHINIETHCKIGIWRGTCIFDHMCQCACSFLGHARYTQIQVDSCLRKPSI